MRRWAVRCGAGPSTAFRWRNRFLQDAGRLSDRLQGLVEADETYLLDSRNGDRKPDRDARDDGAARQPSAGLRLSRRRCKWRWPGAVRLRARCSSA